METATKNFIGRDEWRWPLPDEDFLNFRKEPTPNEAKVKVLRSLLFFYTEQEILMGDLRKFFTEKAIDAFEHDGFIEIKKDKK